MTKSQDNCKKKQAYETQLEANTELLKRWRAYRFGDTSRKERSTYRCPECGKFHLTSKVQTP